jgi:hypothetical protein
MAMNWAARLVTRSSPGPDPTHTLPAAPFARYPVRVGETYERVAVFRSHLYPLAGAASPGGAGQDLAWGGPEGLDEAFSWSAEPVHSAVRGMRRTGAGG